MVKLFQYGTEDDYFKDSAKKVTFQNLMCSEFNSLNILHICMLLSLQLRQSGQQNSLQSLLGSLAHLYLIFT